MNLRNTVVSAMCEWPSLFQRPIQVLDHLFLVIGNGYEWKGGQLVEKGRRKSRHVFDRLFVPWDEEVAAFKKEQNRELQGLVPRSIRGHVRVTTEDSAAHLIRDRIRPVTPYPICEHSRVCRVPDDVRPDWLAGAFWTLDRILSGGFDQRHFDLGQPVSDDTGRRMRDMSLAGARRIKRSLDRRFPCEFWEKELKKFQTLVDRIEEHKGIERFKAEWEIVGPDNKVRRKRKKR